MMEIFYKPITVDIILKIAQVFALANALISMYVGEFLKRKAFAAIRTGLISLSAGICFIWVSIVICLSGAVVFDSINDPLNSNATTTGNIIGIAVRFGVILWIIGVIMLFCLIQKGLSLDKKHFKKPAKYKIPDMSDLDLRGIDEMAEIMEEADKGGGKVRFPVLVIGNEDTKIWEFGSEFIKSALSLNKVAIYFAFSRPFEVPGKMKGEKLSDLHIVDCFSGLHLSRKARCEIEKKNKQYGANVYFCDPRDPGQINKKYSEIIKKNLSKKLSVVYETFSDFMYLTDREVAINFLRNNAAWEEHNHVNSMYLFKKGLIESSMENQIIWFLNTKIELDFVEKFEEDVKDIKDISPTFKITTRMLFAHPRTFSFGENPSFFKKDTPVQGLTGSTI